VNLHRVSLLPFNGALLFQTEGAFLTDCFEQSLFRDVLVKYRPFPAESLVPADLLPSVGTWVESAGMWTWSHSLWVPSASRGCGQARALGRKRVGRAVRRGGIVDMHRLTVHIQCDVTLEPGASKRHQCRTRKPVEYQQGTSVE